MRAVGHRVVISGRRADPLRELAEGAGALAHPADAGDPEAVAGLVAAAVEVYGRVEGLVLSAGSGAAARSATSPSRTGTPS
ncbi:SDR family oxidoreductase [Streptomyces sp. NPDC041068]|uniref:SDR family oxidoreductase n=1 Tax=Streptomyces sp. NPDC041068 TaxID=3155130 RepID=UPI0033C7A86D